MIVIFVILSIMIAATDMIRLSLMCRKISLLWCIVWILAAYFSTIWLAGISAREALECVNIKGICIMGCIEIIIFLSYLFYEGRSRFLLAHYPGLMVAMPIVLLAYWVSRTVCGVSIFATGIVTACVVAIFIMGGVLFLQKIKCDKHWLYMVSVTSIIVYILVYGIL